MAEPVWLEQLQAFSQHLASVGQQAAAKRERLADWFLHQQGLFALGRKPTLVAQHEKLHCRALRGHPEPHILLNPVPVQ